MNTTPTQRQQTFAYLTVYMYTLYRLFYIGVFLHHIAIVFLLSRARAKGRNWPISWEFHQRIVFYIYIYIFVYI